MTTKHQLFATVVTTADFERSLADPTTVSLHGRTFRVRYYVETTLSEHDPGVLLCQDTDIDLWLLGTVRRQDGHIHIEMFQPEPIANSFDWISDLFIYVANALATRHGGRIARITRHEYRFRGDLRGVELDVTADGIRSAHTQAIVLKIVADLTIVASQLGLGLEEVWPLGNAFMSLRYTTDPIAATRRATAFAAPYEWNPFALRAPGARRETME